MKCCRCRNWVRNGVAVPLILQKRAKGLFPLKMMLLTVNLELNFDREAYFLSWEEGDEERLLRERSFMM